VRGVPLGQRPGAGQQGVQLGVGGGVLRRVAEDDVDLEVGGHLVDEPHRLATHLARGALQRAQLAAQVLGAVGGQAGGVQLAQQGPCLVAQCRRRRRGLVGDLGAQPRLPGERVDESRLQPVEPQPQSHVLEREVEREGRHDGSFAAAPGTPRTGRGSQPPNRRCRAE
jgi:hypothetical protein